MEVEEQVCERDGVNTRLTCAGCGAPICPTCLVRTPVGLKCPNCTGTGKARRRSPAPLAAVVALAVVAALAWFAFGGSGSNSKQTATGDGRLDLVDNASESRIGQEVRSGPFSFTVTRVDCVGQEVGVAPNTRIAQGRFCLLYLSLRNIGDRPSVYSGAGQLLIDSAARRYSPGVMDAGPPPPPLTITGGVREITSIRLNPGATADGVLVFDMPVAAKPAEFEFHSGPRTIGNKVRLDTLAP